MIIEERSDQVVINAGHEEYSSGRADSVREAVAAAEARRRPANRRRVLIRILLGVHEATETELAEAPRGRLFPRPVRNVGAATPEVLAEELTRYAARREQPRSDISRVLWSEFLAAAERDGPGDGWAKRIEKRLDEVRAARGSGTPVSYATVKTRRRSR